VSIWRSHLACMSSARHITVAPFLAGMHRVEIRTRLQLQVHAGADEACRYRGGECVAVVL